MDVVKQDADGAEILRYPVDRIVAQTADLIRIEARFSLDDVETSYVTFKKDDKFVETYYRDRWYNVFALYDRDDGRFKGWYCNICRPAVWDAAVIACDDLALDVWVWPDARHLLRDEDEFAALGLPEHEKKQALAAVDTVRRLAEDGRLPR